MSKKEIWFKAKNYGYGWYPATWQAWIILAIWLVIFVFSLISIEKNNLLLRTLIIVISTWLLIWISWKKGEKAKWRWGK